VDEIKNISYYHDILHLHKQDYSIGDQLTGMANSPNLSPAHYAFLLFWNRIVGDDYIDYRLFSIFVYLLTLLFLFLFPKTLFQSGLSAWIIISLFSVSPFCHVYIQEARYYILWVFKNLKSQFGERMNSFEQYKISPVWKIKF
jgi:uncharacterized membrane protein